jgi:hypothetical protein
MAATFMAFAVIAGPIVDNTKLAAGRLTFGLAQADGFVLM